MRKNFGRPWTYPQPVLILATCRRTAPPTP